MREMQEMQDVRDAEQDERFDVFESDLRRLHDNLEQVFQRHRQDLERRFANTNEDNHSTIDSMRHEMRTRLGWLDEQAQHLRGLVAEVENIPTRRVEWNIPEASAVLTGLPQNPYRSPDFEAAGAHGLHLELRHAETRRGGGPRA